jgi:hypothetical protein
MTDWNPDTGGRSLAEILREAGIESATRASRRKRWDDPEEAGLRQRRAEAAAEGAARAGYGRRRSDQEAPVAARALREPRDVPREPRDVPPAPRDVQPPREPRRPMADPSTAAIPGMRPDRKPGVPAAAAPAAAPAVAASAVAAPAAPERPDTDRRAGGSRVDDRRAADRLPKRSRAERTGREPQHASTGPIPAVRTDDLTGADLDSGPRDSALAWLRFAGELVIALAVGVGVYFAATVLWEMVPYVAVLLAPVAVTGLVAGVGVWRQRMGREAVGARLLAVLVFAGTLLTIAPAAALLAGA